MIEDGRIKEDIQVIHGFPEVDSSLHVISFPSFFEYLYKKIFDKNVLRWQTYLVSSNSNYYGTDSYTYSVY